MKLREISKENIFSRISGRDRPWQKGYLSMYSSQWQGFTTDPELMMIPIDDHLVHRGDGAFDVMRCLRGKIYQMEEHIQRLERSAKAISLELPSDYSEIRDIVKQLVLLGGEKECLIRMVLSRGPGSFGISPYDCPSSQMYVNVIRYHDPPNKYYKEGIPLVTSNIPIKKSFFANIKSCNYLPNVLMKIEALKKGCQYSVALDEEGFLAEGSTENIGVLIADGVLKFPRLERTLSGTTVRRVSQLADVLVKEKIIKEVKFDQISLEDAYAGKEIFLTGTSLNILPVVSYDERCIGDGVPGPVYSRLSSLLWKDMTKNQELLTQIDWDREE